MSNAVWWEFLIMIPAAIFGTYAIAWSFPAVIIFPVISLGSFKHIIFMDKELAKDLNKLYDQNGYMRPKYQMPNYVGTRCVNYCIAYPFIRKRSTTKSKKFKAFMWFNALGMWSYIGLGCFGLLGKLFNII